MERVLFNKGEMESYKRHDAKVKVVYSIDSEWTYRDIEKVFLNDNFLILERGYSDFVMIKLNEITQFMVKKGK